jgi:hypothetical protein
MKKIFQIVVLMVFLTGTGFCSSALLYGAGLYGTEETKPVEAKIVPWGEIKLQYDDNVFLSQSDEKEDFIVTLTPGITAYLPFSDNLLKFDYHADFIRFLDNSSQDATNQYVYGGMELNWRDVTFNVYDQFSHVFERPSFEDVSRIKRDDNRAGITAKIKKDRLGIQLGYENFKRDYKSEPEYDQYDRTDNLYSVILTHQTFPKTELLLEYDFDQITYDHSDVRSDGDYHQILVGAIGQLTPKTTASVKAGYQLRSYDNYETPDYKTGVVYSDITHKFSDKDAIKLSLYRAAEESTYKTNNYYKVDSVSGTFDHFFTPKLLGFITGLYQFHSYPTETTEGSVTQKREDKYYSAGVGLKYYLQKWLTLTLQADHIIRDSNFEEFDYNQNLVTFSAKAIF